MTPTRLRRRLAAVALAVLMTAAVAGSVARVGAETPPPAEITGTFTPVAPTTTAPPPSSADLDTPGGRISLTVAPGQLSGLQAVSLLGLPRPPRGIGFLFGAIRFEITGLTPGATVTVTATTPRPTSSYWKLVGGRWIQVGSFLRGLSVTFELTDGGVGDDDGVANGTIVDPGALGVPTEDGVDEPAPDSAGPIDGSGTPAPASATQPRGALPFTGTDPWPTALMGLLALTLGAAAVVVSLRRRVAGQAGVGTRDSGGSARAP